MKYPLDVLHYSITSHITKTMESIIRGQGGRLLPRNITKLCNVALTQSINYMLIGLKTKVIAICKTSGNGNDKSANVSHILALHL